MKATVILVVLTILGSLCQGKPVNKKKKPGKVNDKPKQGKITTRDIYKKNDFYQIVDFAQLKWEESF